MKEKERKVDKGEEKEEEEEEERTREKGREKGTRAKESEADKSAVGYRAPAAGDEPGVGWAARRPLGRDGRTSEILCTDERSITYPASLKWQEKRKPKRRPHISVSLAENNERAEDRQREKRRNKPQPKQTETPSEGTCTSPSGFHRRDRATSTPSERQILYGCAGQSVRGKISVSYLGVLSVRGKVCGAKCAGVLVRLNHPMRVAFISRL